MQDSLPQYDVIVCGGGPAGIGAAVAAGRAGAKTLLVEATSCLGGVLGNAQVHTFCDSPGGPVFDILTERLLALDAGSWQQNPVKFRPPGRLHFQPETARAIALELVLEAAVDIRLCTLAITPILAGPQVIGVNLASKAGPVATAAKVVVDCTADADIAAAAGSACRQGDPEDGRIQVCNFRWAIGGVDREAYEHAHLTSGQLAALFGDAVNRGLIQPPEALVTQHASFPVNARTGTLSLCNWELPGVDPTNAAQVSRTLAQCQLAALQIVRYCREHLPGYAQCRIERLPVALGTRESRRIVGQYTLTNDDVLHGRKFADGIAKAWFWVDFHDPPPGITIPHDLDYVLANQPPPGDWYEIPYRSLVPADRYGLLVAGRCLSCDRAALASLRVMPTCMFTGTAAGMAAAHAALSGISTHAVDGNQLKQRLLSP